MEGPQIGPIQAVNRDQRRPFLISRQPPNTAGQIWLGYDEPKDKAVARSLPAEHPVLKKIADALNGLTDEAVKK